MAYITDGKGTWDVPEGTEWYHGSPLELSVLKSGGSITRNRELAGAFSHRPTQVSMGDDSVIRHNGTETGYLYVVDEPLVPAIDMHPHPACLENDPWEWVTTRELRLSLVETLAV